MSNFFVGSVQPLTSYLYSGESFDFTLGQQYLRARWYDATTGRFNRLDPFAGNSQDPQSFHKYGYVHGDPVQGVDPSGKFVAVLIPTLIQGGVRNGDAARGAQALNTAYNLQRAVKVYQKAIRVLEKIRDAYDTINDALDLLSIDIKDLSVLRESVLKGSANVLPNKYVGPIEIPIPSRLLDSLALVWKYGHRILGHYQTQEFVGELMTDVIAYSLGFEQANLNWHKVHGPDQVVKHTSVPGLWGGFEAKGGSHGLNAANTKKGTQMSKEWISGWLGDIVENNQGTTDGMLLEAAWEDENDMLALVSRLDIRNIGKTTNSRIKATFELGFQVYKPQKGLGLKDWKGFQNSL